MKLLKLSVNFVLMLSPMDGRYTYQSFVIAFIFTRSTRSKKMNQVTFHIRKPALMFINIQTTWKRPQSYTWRDIFVYKLK